MGWSEGLPLGISGDGRVDPIPFRLKNDSTGIGKITQDVRMVETTVSQRRGLDSERQQKETEDQRKAREELVARKAALETEITSTLRAFYCELCDKQFKTVAQYDEHTNSYAHHHKARLRDMNANARPKPKEDVDKRKEKERRREEKELRKIAAANGIKMAKPPAAAPTPSATAVPELTSSASGGFLSQSEAEPKKGGWAAVAPSGPQPGFKKSGWATISSQPTPAPAAPPAELPSISTLSSHAIPVPAFRNAGWTSLDTGSTLSVPASVVPAPPPPSQSHPPPPTPSEPGPVPPAVPVRPAGGGWKQFQSSIKGKTRR